MDTPGGKQKGCLDSGHPYTIYYITIERRHCHPFATGGKLAMCVLQRREY